MAIKIIEDTLRMHKQAMWFAQDAVVAKSQGQELTALYNFNQALKLELQVLKQVLEGNTHIETQGIISRSAASLAFQCYQYDNAFNILSQNNSYEYPSYLQEELDSLLIEIEGAKSETESVKLSRTVIIIEKEAASRAILADKLRKVTNVIFFENVLDVSEYLKHNDAPAIIALALKKLTENTSDLDQLLTLMGKFHLLSRTNLILLADEIGLSSDFTVLLDSYINNTVKRPFDIFSFIKYISEYLEDSFPHISDKREYVISYQCFNPTPIPKVQITKRLLDILVSLFLIVVLIPLFTLISLAIKVETPGPIFISSRRIGFSFRIFNFYKFRTMEINADKKIMTLGNLNHYLDKKKSPKFFKINDPRITRVGRFLRNTNLDELPQLLNVLRGDMSMVGNRPIPEYEAYSLTDSNSIARFLAPAGITGLWQIRKRKGRSLSWEERLKSDLEYVKRNNFLFDLYIMMSTPRALIQSNDAVEIEEDID